MKNTIEEKTAFKFGDQVMWTPVKSRRGYYGHPDAMRPMLCEVIGVREKSQTCIVKIIEKSAMKNRNNKFEAVNKSLRKIEYGMPFP